MLLVVPFVEGSMPLVGWTPSFIEPQGRSAAFLPTAILFGLFSLPIFLRVREPRTVPGPRPTWIDSWRSVRDAFTDAKRYPGVGWFLLGNFFLLDAIHTAIVFMAVYAQKVVGLPDSAKVVFFMLATIPAIFGSFAAGWVADRIGARRVLLVTAWMWAVCSLAIVAVPSVEVFYALGAVVGFMLGSVWTVSRPLLLQLTPAGEEGKLFGAYAFCNKSAAFLGPQLWGVTVLLGAPLGTDKYRLALTVLGALAALGAFFLHRVPERPRGPSPSTGGRLRLPHEPS
jgi:UMF1 family MFS transporter